MAKLETTVRSPLGPVFDMDGRVPTGVALETAQRSLERQILRLQDHLRELDNWTVVTHRGDLKVKSFEEMRK